MLEIFFFYDFLQENFNESSSLGKSFHIYRDGHHHSNVSRYLALAKGKLTFPEENSTEHASTSLSLAPDSKREEKNSLEKNGFLPIFIDPKFSLWNFRENFTNDTELYDEKSSSKLLTYEFLVHI